ncbi:MAG: DNA mismatch repair protein MutS [Defluviitaleaceae bacterium]|nr:DNA mismatch repair protein MutS [Defluviitaleaceae bacterium]
MNWSPMMQQYLKIKDAHKDALIFFRLGDFYELFFEDAHIVADALGLQLTQRDTGKGKAPMCGVPHHSADGYIRKLVELGHDVALCEQIQQGQSGKAIMERNVVRVFTPGTLFDDEGEARYIAAICAENTGFGIAYCDVSTGDFYAASFDTSDKLLDEITKIRPAEIVAGSGFDDCEFDVPTKTYHFWAFMPSTAQERLINHFGKEKFDAFGSIPRPALSAGGGLLEYLYETQLNNLSHIIKLNLYNTSTYMPLDQSARRNLELFETMLGQERKGSLLWVLDDTKTPMGRRLLCKWMMSPLIGVDDINTRQKSVKEYAENPALRDNVRASLAKIGDLERFCAKITYKRTTPRDILVLEKSMEAIQNLPKSFAASLNTYLADNLDYMGDLLCKIRGAISFEEGRVFANGFHQKLDNLRSHLAQILDEIGKYEQEQRVNTGIKGLKVNQNKIFGYYIEIPNSQRNKIPEGYTSRQTLANHQRYSTETLKQLEVQLLTNTQEIADLEEALLNDLRNQIADEAHRIQSTAHILAHMDALQSLGEVACKHNYCCPKLNTKGITEIKDGRHPVIEQLFPNFEPNDLNLSHDKKIAIITGPNMAGKSTFMRQTALIQIMAQIGSFVPAKSANLTICDQIFTRVGAGDDLSRGRSTFMVEMAELAYILDNATANSLILLDEVGRGTGTSDGLSIAVSVLEYIAEKVGAKTLFATHYHELVASENKIGGVFNLSMAVEESGGSIKFLWKVVEGGTDKSHGIFVAKMAGLPETVVERSLQLHNKIVVQGIFGEDALTKDSNINYLTAKEVMQRFRMHLDEHLLTEIITKKEAETARRVLDIIDKHLDGKGR